MIIIGPIRKMDSNNSSILGSLIDKKWETVVFENENIQLKVLYNPASNIRIIDDKTAILKQLFLTHS